LGVVPDLVDKSKLVFRLYTILNLLAALVWILIFVERTSRTRNPISDIGVPIGLISLFFLVPLSAVSIWLLTRRRKEPIPRSWATYFLLSKIFLFLSWLPSWIPMIFVAGIVSLGVSHTWPFSLSEGPDTRFAQRCFERHFGLARPPSVKEIYCRESWEFGDGNTYRIRFHFTDDAVVEHIVKTFGLEPLANDEAHASWVREASPPSWWPSPDLVRYQVAYRRGRSSVRLWVDREGRLMYYRSWP
jgi:hypothetical protein